MLEAPGERDAVGRGAALEAAAGGHPDIVAIDVDVHHGDGVQAAFYDDSRVCTVSLHETGRYLFPGSGEIHELGRPPGTGRSVNVPLEPRTGDDGFLAAFDGVVEPLAAAFRPDLLVTATGPDGVGVHLVDADGLDGLDGLDRQAQRTSDGDAAALVTFAGTASTRIGGADVAERLGQLLVALSAAEQLGVTEGALRLTAEYAKTREQFGRPIGTFQAVSQRLADGFIDVLGQRLTLWQAIWRLDEGLPAATEVATAKLWAADAGHRIAHTTVHVHGGVGIDLDGEAHRYFTSGKRFEFLFGGATEQALAIGRTFA